MFLKDINNYNTIVQKVLERLQAYKLYANLKKYQFNIKEVEFLKYIINKNGIKINLSKVELVVN